MVWLTVSVRKYLQKRNSPNVATLRASDFAGLSDNGYNFLYQLVSELSQAKSAINQLLTDYNAHTHSGVTVGAGTSGAVSAASTAVAVVAGETSDPGITPTVT